ncbi:MAG: hypothetical protein HY401_09690 [Elusimicrobia bacterium]|nr:hypothetical protein [Elusimicrobiota bacterium]
MKKRSKHAPAQEHWPSLFEKVDAWLKMSPADIFRWLTRAHHLNHALSASRRTQSKNRAARTPSYQIPKNKLPRSTR